MHGSAGVPWFRDACTREGVSVWPCVAPHMQVEGDSCRGLGVQAKPWKAGDAAQALGLSCSLLLQRCPALADRSALPYSWPRAASPGACGAQPPSAGREARGA